MLGRGRFWGCQQEKSGGKIQPYSKNSPTGKFKRRCDGASHCFRLLFYEVCDVVASGGYGKRGDKAFFGFEF